LASQPNFVNGQGGIIEQTIVGNPSHAAFRTKERTKVHGANIGFFDASAQWVNLYKLEFVGDDDPGSYGGDVLSVMPR